MDRGRLSDRHPAFALVAASVVLNKHDGRFVPRERVAGHAYWDLDRAPAFLEVRLVWHTEGKGTGESVVVGRERLRDPAPQGRVDFSFQLPDMPYTYHGQILSILWSVDLFGPGGRPWRREARIASAPLITSPTMRPYGVPVA